ncbi:MAG: hypothetical protein ONB23_01095 [candidate division KSB1 bacterium]|nr:hypothetical protein [candidate division KSB1 bacterium]
MSLPTKGEPGMARRRRMVACVGAWVVAAFPWLAPQHLAAQPRTNLEVFEILLRETVEPLLDSLAVPRLLPVVLEVRPEGSEGAWFVETRLAHEMARRGLRLVSAGTAQTSEALRFSLRVDQLAVATRPSSNARRDSLQREVLLRLSGWLKDQRGGLLWGGLLERRHVDVIAARDLARVEESPYEFTYARRQPSGSRLGAIVEGAVAGAALGIVTLLFFIYRTR